MTHEENSSNARMTGAQAHTGWTGNINYLTVDFADVPLDVGIALLCAARETWRHCQDIIVDVAVVQR